MIKQIPGHRQYVIDSETQNVYRIDGARTKDKPLTKTFRCVKGKSFPNGYYLVTLLTKDYMIDGEVVDIPHYLPIYLHRVMCLTFLEPPTEKHVWVNHKDRNKLNNSLDNLEWNTISQNIQHKFDTGLYVTPKGEEHWRTGKKLSVATKNQMSKAKIGSLHPKFKGLFIVNGKRFESANQAGKFFKIPPKTIIARSNNPKFKDYSFIPIDNIDRGTLSKT